MRLSARGRDQPGLKRDAGGDFQLATSGDFEMAIDARVRESGAGHGPGGTASAERSEADRHQSQGVGSR